MVIVETFVVVETEVRVVEVVVEVESVV